MAKSFSDNQVERLLDLVPYLITNPGVSLDKIAIDFKSNRAGVIEDLNTLWMCGLPGYTPLELIDLSFDTGFVSIRNADILSKPRKLSTHELAAVIVGLSILRESLSEESFHYSTVSELLRKLSASSHVPAPVSVKPSVAPEIRKVVDMAIKKEGTLSVTYYSLARDQESQRFITPIAFQVIDQNEYVDSYCHTSLGFRSFRLDRFKEVSLNDLNSANIVTQESGDSVKKEFSIQILSHARQISETFRIDVPVNTDKEFEVLCSAYNEEWVVRSISGLNNSAVVSNPPALRQKIAEQAKKALKIYE